MMYKDSKNIQVVHHPLIQSLLTKIRDISTNNYEFRQSCKILSRFLVYEAIKDLNMRLTEVKTPVGNASGVVLTDYVILAPVLRAGLVMAEEAQILLPNAKIYHIGLKRNEETLEAMSYYSNLPKQIPTESVVFILDPMLATGGSALSVCKLFDDLKISNINLVSIVSAPEGIDKIHSNFPHIKIITASIDKCLNEKGYIVPGLGDCGDRLFAT